MIAITIFLVSLFAPSPILEENKWKKSLEKDDITIYTRPVEESNFKEFLAEATMEGSIDKFIDIFTDIESYPSWMPDCKSAETVNNPTPNDITYHMKLKVPFPFAKRDIVQQIILHQNGNVLEIDVLNRPNKLKKLEKYVRMPEAQGKWIITETTDHKISIKFQYFADPGGDIPAWLVNSFIVKNPHLTLLNVKKMMAD